MPSKWMGDVGKGAAEGAAMGATLGTVVPGVGNAVGAVAGAVGGGLVGLARNLFPDTAGALLDGPSGQAVAPLIEATVRNVAGADTPEAVVARMEDDPALRDRMAEQFRSMVEMERIAAADRADARKHDTDASQMGLKTTGRLAWFILGSFLTVCVIILVGCGFIVAGRTPSIRENPEIWVAVSGLVGTILGQIAGSANNVVSFYFGSSASSGRKDGVIGGMLDQNQQTTIRRAGSR